MSSSSSSSSTGASQRASEVNSAMLNIPGYADDTMLFMLRWGSLAKSKEADVLLNRFLHSTGNQATLRKVDYDEFLVRLSALNTHWFKSQSQSQSQSQSRNIGQDDGELQAEANCANDREGSDYDAAAATATTNTTVTIATVTIATVTTAAATAFKEDDDEAAVELKARTLELIQDFPNLVRDFEKFVDCTRVMAAKYGKAPA